MKEKIEIKSMAQKPTESGCEVTFGLVIKGHERDLVYKIHGEGISSVAERCDDVVSLICCQKQHGYCF